LISHSGCIRGKLSLVLLGDLATEDHGDLLGLADGTIGIQQSLAELIQCGSPMEDQVVTIFNLREEEPVLTPRFFAGLFPSAVWLNTTSRITLIPAL
jgi:hypothetical protein